MTDTDKAARIEKRLIKIVDNIPYYSDGSGAGWTSDHARALVLDLARDMVSAGIGLETIKSHLHAVYWAVVGL